MPQKSLFIKKSVDFKRVFREGRKYISPHFVLYAAGNAAAGGPRLGINIAKASVPLATRRNRIKRIAREFWRAREKSRYGKRDFVLVVRKGTDGLRNAEIFKELNSLFNKILS